VTQLSSYFSKFLVQVLFITLLAAAGLLTLAKLTDVLDDILRYKGTDHLVAKYLLSLLPGFIYFSLPLAAFFAGGLFSARFRQSNEILAVWSAGTSLWQVLRPAIWAALAAMVVILWLENQQLPKATQASSALYGRLIGKPIADAEAGVIDGLHIRTKDFRFYVRAFDLMHQTGTDCIFQWNSVDGIRRHDICAGIKNRGSDILATQCTSFFVSLRPSSVRQLSFDSVEISSKELAALLKFNPPRTEHASFAELLKTTEYNRARGLESHPVWTEFFGRIFYPLVIPLALFLGVYAGIRFARGGLALVLTLALLFTMIYIILLYTLRSLGNAGTLPPPLASALPNTCLFVSCWLSHRRSKV
jgi:lipopolysaccharide export LptBFGC system permease protein LptF